MYERLLQNREGIYQELVLFPFLMHVDGLRVKEQVKRLIPIRGSTLFTS